MVVSGHSYAKTKKLLSGDEPDIVANLSRHRLTIS